MKSANLTRAPRPADPALTPPPEAPPVKAKPRTRKTTPTTGPAAVAKAPAAVEPGLSEYRPRKPRPEGAPPLGRPPGTRVKRTVYVDAGLYGEVDRRYLAMLPEGREGRFPLAVVLDEVLRHGLGHWPEVAAAVTAAVAKADQAR